MIIVTGGAGFIGSNIIRELNRRGIDDILVVDSLEKGEKHLNLNRLRFADFVDYHDFLSGLDVWQGGNVEVIFHQGANTDTMEYNGRLMMAQNYDYSKALLRFAEQRGSRFIYASSAAVYGDGDEGFREDPHCEYPLNVYGYSKLLFDNFVRRLPEDRKGQIVGLRYFNVFGPQENHKQRMASVIYQFHHQILAENKIRPFAGSDSFLRDFIYVQDVVKVNMFFFDHPEVSGIFNCGTGEARSFQHLAEIMSELYDGVGLEEVPFPESLQGKYQKYTQSDVNQLRSAGFSDSFTPLEEAVADYVKILKTSRGLHVQEA